MFPTDGRPGDQRGFVHKRLLRGVSKLAGLAGDIGIPGARTVSSITGRLGGRIQRPPLAPRLQISTPRPTAPRTRTARVTPTSQAQKQRGLDIKFADTFGLPPLGVSGGRGRGPCDFPMEIAPDGSCREPTVDQFGRPLGGVGEAVMGRYGAALEPGSQIIDRAICLRGMQLGDDGLCYNKSQITNKQRMWPAGRKPLLSGGDMRAISIAARAGRRLDNTTKRLRKLGMMKALPAPRKAPHQHAKAATGVVSV